MSRITSLLLVGAGTAAGWIAHRAVESGRRAVDQETGRRLQETLDPTRLGRSAGQAGGDAAAEALAQSAQAFTERLRADAPPWVSQLIGPPRDTIEGETLDTPDTTATPSSVRKDPHA